jgi:hypothetical protein
MNDLAEKALHGLNVARRAIVARPMTSFAVGGSLLSATIVAAGARVNGARPTRPLSTWFGLVDAGSAANAWQPATVMLSATVAFALLWLAAVRSIRRREQPEPRVWAVAGAWALPFAIGPPLLGTAVQSYVAYGQLQRNGLSPYDYGPSRLAGSDALAAIEPAARETLSSAGPLGTLVQHLAVSISSGSSLGALLVLRGLGIVCWVLLARLAAELAGPSRSRAITLTALNPLVLFYVVSAARLEALMLVCVLAALSAAMQRRWFAAIVLGSIAGSVTGQGVLVLPAIAAVHLLGRRSASVWLVLGRDLAVAAGTTVLAAMTVDDGFGWLRTVSKQFPAHPPYSIASAVANLLEPIVRGASYDDLAAGARITVLTALVSVEIYLIVTARQRSLERSAGYALLALGLLAPVLYPWYLLAGLVCLAPAATGVRRVLVLALSVAGCLLIPPGFSPTTTDVLSGIALGVIALVLISMPSVRRLVPEPQN